MERSQTWKCKWSGPGSTYKGYCSTRASWKAQAWRKEILVVKNLHHLALFMFNQEISTKSMWDPNPGGPLACSKHRRGKETQMLSPKVRGNVAELTGAFPSPGSLAPAVVAAPALAALWFYQRIKYLVFPCSRICDPGSLYSEFKQNNTGAQHGAFFSWNPEVQGLPCANLSKTDIPLSQRCWNSMGKPHREKHPAFGYKFNGFLYI